MPPSCSALAPAHPLRCYGDPRLGVSGLEFYHPELEWLADSDALPDLEQTLTPIYPLTEGISQNRMRQIMAAGLALLEQHPPEELLPAAINQRFGVDNLAQALHFIHCPPIEAQVSALSGHSPYQQRLAFEELLAHNLAVWQSRLQAKQNRHRYNSSGQPGSPTVARPALCTHTGAGRVIDEIRRDMATTAPMLRMVQGDGIGQTLVAALACAYAVEAGWQVVIAAPRKSSPSSTARISLAGLNPSATGLAGWRVSSRPGKTQRLPGDCRRCCAHSGGHHALFEEHVLFQRLGLVIIDEQHRFGVAQRLSLRGKNPDGAFPTNW